MLKLLIGTDWISNRDAIMDMIAQDVKNQQNGRVLIVPESISHDTERRLAEIAGDTTSRFAEVLSFTRLANRVSEVVGQSAYACMDNGGRVVAMAAAARMLHSRLKAYAAVETRPEFLGGLLDAVDEFKRCCVSSEDLKRASEVSEGSLAQKLEELSLLLETYDALCTRGKRDPRDLMNWLLEQLEDCTYAQEHIFYIDGFPDYSRQNLQIIGHIIEKSPQVVITVNCDELGSGRIAFEKAGETALELKNLAVKAGVDVQICHIPPRQDALSSVRNFLYQGNITKLSEGQTHLRVCMEESVYSECLAAAEVILEKVRTGVRYKDIAIVCADMAGYEDTLAMVLERCKIPMYRSGTEAILDKSVIHTVLSALDSALDGFEQRDMIRYLKSPLSPLTTPECDKIENYAIMWNINGSRWCNDWTNHPAGLGEGWTAALESELQRLNILRKKLVDPLVSLRKSFHDAVTLKEQVLAIYSFLESIGMAQRLQNLAMEIDAEGDYRSAQILNQLWEILLSALEQLHDTLGDTVWDPESFSRLLKLLLSQYDVGTIPPVLDAVMVGSVSAMRCQQVEHLIVVGALEGNLPGYSGNSGVLTDLERMSLRKLGIPLSSGATDGLDTEFAEIYGVFCGACSSVTVLCPAGQPSFVFRRLQDLAGGCSSIDTTISCASADQMESAAFLARMDALEHAQVLGAAETCKKIISQRAFSLGRVEPDHIKDLYGTKLNLSASQIDRQAECRLSYFLKYGMRAKERKALTVDPAEFGTYVHAILEQTGIKIMEQGGFKEVSLEETLKIAKEYSEAYALERFAQLDSERVAYLFHRNVQELELVVQELWQEMQDCAFVPTSFELAFGKNGALEAIHIPANSMDASLMGVVDRVDTWHENGQDYFRVVDYKTGKKDFDYCDVFNGVGLQMLLYLYALEDEQTDILGPNPVPAGVQYFPARVPLITSDGKLTDAEAAEVREKAWKRKGLLIADETVLSAMETAEKPVRLSYTRKKDGSIAGDIADRKQFSLLKAYVFLLLGRLVDDIASGCVDPNPYTRGSSHSACTYCPYGTICHPETVENRRNYKTMSAQRFWDEIEKEMSKHG